MNRSDLWINSICERNGVAVLPKKRPRTDALVNQPQPLPPSWPEAELPHPANGAWEDQSGRYVFIVDAKGLHQVAMGQASLQQETARPLLNQITEKLFMLSACGALPPKSWADPVEWRPREFNKRVDHLCN